MQKRLKEIIQYQAGVLLEQIVAFVIIQSVESGEQLELKDRR